MPVTHQTATQLLADWPSTTEQFVVDGCGTRKNNINKDSEDSENYFAILQINLADRMPEISSFYHHGLLFSTVIIVLWH